MSVSGWKGTPGPWRYRNDGVAGCRNITAKPGNPLHRQVRRTELATTVGLWNDDEDMANAYGMAAVPQLVEAAEKALARLEDMDWSSARDDVEQLLMDALRAAKVL